jgi:hypothetical protein
LEAITRANSNPYTYKQTLTAGQWDKVTLMVDGGAFGGNYTIQVGNPTYSISGTVWGPGGGGLAGVTVTLSETSSDKGATLSRAAKAGKSSSAAGTAGSSTVTDANGDYSFSGLEDGDYTITPSMAGYTFSPPSLAPTVNDEDVTGEDFTATSTTTYSISGTVSGSGGGGLAGVTVTLGSASSHGKSTGHEGPAKAGKSSSAAGTAGSSTVTDANGDYSFSGLTNGTYTITPSMASCTFSPASLSATVNGADVTGEDFTATCTSNMHIHYTLTPVTGTCYSGDPCYEGTPVPGDLSGLQGTIPISYTVTPPWATGYANMTGSVTISPTTPPPGAQPGTWVQIDVTATWNNQGLGWGRTTGIFCTSGCTTGTDYNPGPFGNGSLTGNASYIAALENMPEIWVDNTWDVIVDLSLLSN